LQDTLANFQITTTTQDNTNHTMQAITITFGDQAENHVGMQKIGAMADSGFSIAELKAAKAQFEDLGCTCELVDLRELVKDGKQTKTKKAKGGNKRKHDDDERVDIGNEKSKNEEEGNCVDDERYEVACVLVVRGGVEATLNGKLGSSKKQKTESSAFERDDNNNAFSLEALFNEQQSLDTDKKAFMYGRVVNKYARHNLCFSEESQEPEYDKGMGRVVAFKDVPVTNRLREQLGVMFGDKAKNLPAEGNYYFDSTKCGIGWHGDAERKKVIAVRLGTSIPLAYHWFLESKPIGKQLTLQLNHGDMYAMSEKATGWDWRKKVTPTLRHAAGAAKFLALKKS
jgi:alkylated DNA repair dioxygenase AlkB